jgi:Tol biopolymer transport system component
VARITSDLDGYPNFSISADGETIAAVRRSTVSNLWVARVDIEDDATPLTFASGSAASMAQLAPLPGGATVFSAPRDNRFVLWRMAADGSGRQQLTEDGVWIFDISWTETNGIVFSQVVTRPEVEAHVWHIDPDGTGLEQLTHGESEQLAAVSPDGTRLLYKHWSRPGELWALGLDGSEPRLFAEDADGVSGFSPDGERVLLTRIEDQGDGRFYPVRHVLLFDGGASQATFRLPPGAFDLEWSPDGESVTFIDRSQGWNLMRKRLPDGVAEPLTSFSEGQLIGHEWHRDGSRVALHRRFAQKESLWQLETGRSEPTLVVEYMTGRLSRYRWAPDAPLLYYAYSTSTQDVVMMTGVR